MDEVIAKIKQLNKGGHTKIVYMTDEAKAMGLKEGDELFCVFTTLRNKDFIRSRLYNTDRNLFFVIARIIDDRLVFHIEKAVSEYQISDEHHDTVTVLGPVETCDEAHDMIEYLEQLGCEPTETALKEGFRRFRHSRVA